MPFPRYPSGSCPCQVSLPFELRHFPAGSLFPLSRIEFVSYRLVVLLRLLPTPPHDDAVAVEYGPENVCPVGTFTLLFKCAYERTGRPARAAPRLPAPVETECRSVPSLDRRRLHQLCHLMPLIPDPGQKHPKKSESTGESGSRSILLRNPTLALSQLTLCRQDSRRQSCP